MRIRLGANPIIWSNDDMQELGAETSLETCLAEARQIGFEGMELGHKFPRDARELAAILDRFGLACVSGWYSAELLARDARAEISYLRPHLDLLKAVGSSVLVFADVSGARCRCLGAVLCLKDRARARQGCPCRRVRASEDRELELPARGARGRVHCPR